MKCKTCGKEFKGVLLEYYGDWECSDCNKEDVIHSEEGTKIFLETFSAGSSYEQLVATNHLSFFKEYTVDKIEVGSWHTDVWLKEIPEISFNSVFFVRA